MILTGTTDTLSINLSGNVETSQLQFVCSYNSISASSVVLVEGSPTSLNIPYFNSCSVNNGTTNGVSTVTMMPSPTTGNINQLRSCSIYNSDTASATIVVSHNAGSTRTVIFSSALKTQETAVFSYDNGWQIFNSNGELKMLGMYDGPQSLRFSPGLKPTGLTTTITMASNYNYGVYLGRADRSYSSIVLKYNVAASSLSRTNASEVGIYKSKINIGSGTTRLNFCGYTGFTQNVGIRTLQITTTGITHGDDVFVVFYNDGTTATTISFRSGIYDDLDSGFIGNDIVEAGGSTRPSLNPSFSIDNTPTNNIPWIAWQGLQW